MERTQFKISIDAPREKVWDILWSESTYPEWTSAFSEGSRAETDWKKGSKVLFLGSSNEGMVAKIEDNIPNEFMSIRHVGVVKDGVEDLTSSQAQEWSGSLENYTLRNVNNKTELVVEMDITDEYRDYFNTTFPKALGKVKELAEKTKVTSPA